MQHSVAYSFKSRAGNQVKVYNVRAAVPHPSCAAFASRKWVMAYAVVNDQHWVRCYAAYSAPSDVKAAGF